MLTEDDFLGTWFIRIDSNLRLVKGSLQIYECIGVVIKRGVSFWFSEIALTLMLYFWSFKFYFLPLILIYFLQILRSNHPTAVFSAMEAIMTNVLDESEEISLDLLRPILASVRKENQVLFIITFNILISFVCYS